MSPRIAPTRIAVSRASAQAGFTGNPCLVLFDRPDQITHTAPAARRMPTTQDQLGPSVPSAPPKSRIVWSSGATVCPVVVYQDTLRHTRSPPSVTMKDG